MQKTIIFVKKKLWKKNDWRTRRKTNKNDWGTKRKTNKATKNSRKTDQIKNRNTEQKSIDFLFSKDSLIEESTFELNKIVEL